MPQLSLHVRYQGEADPYVLAASSSALLTQTKKLAAGFSY
jgi:hypothetical protein